MKEKRLKGREKGITLIALVITIIVLLILAGVTIASLTGDNGILSRAQDAKDKTESAGAEENETLGSYENLIDKYAGNNENAGGDGDGGDPEEPLDVDLTTKESIWFGDSVMRGMGNTVMDKDIWGNPITAGFPEYYYNKIGSNNIKTMNMSISGSVITSDNGVESVTTVIKNTIQEVVSTYLGQSIDVKGSIVTLPKAEDIDFVVLDGGGNDVITYEPLGQVSAQYKKEIGTISDTSSDTVLNDFRKTINLIKQSMPNAKLLYLQPIAVDNVAFEIMYLKYKVIGEMGIDQINQTFSAAYFGGREFTTIEEFRNAVIREEPYGANPDIAQIRKEIEELCARGEAYYTQLPELCRELGVEYLDFSDKIIAKRAKDGSDTNPYIQADTIHITDKAYTDFTPDVVDKIKQLFK